MHSKISKQRRFEVGILRKNRLFKKRLNSEYRKKYPEKKPSIKGAGTTKAAEFLPADQKGNEEIGSANAKHL